MEKLNITLEIERDQVPNFEHWLKMNVTVLDFRVVPDTSTLYENNEIFKRLSKAVKTAQITRDRFYNENR
tara:strand:+ start:92 stop:301 length:210 start_codon:yes stop_codon:yes gene_type:complete